jgi:hypothetical protein
MQYETPLYVVPTSKASTNLRERPRYGSREGMLWVHVAVRIGEVEELARSKNP